MNFTPLLPQLQDYQQETHNLLRQSRVVLCVGDRALLCLLTAQAMESATVLAAVTTAEECRAAVQRDGPTLLLLSDQLERGNAITLLEEIKRQQPQIHVFLMVGQPVRRHAIERAIKAHCDGVVLLSRLGTGTMAAALRAVSGGGAYVDRSLREIFHSCPDGSGPLEPLTARECQVLQQVALGESNQEIGRFLYLSTDTVKTHLARILRKLPARDRTHAALRGVRWGLIDWPDELGGG
ncbi:MAG: response regulator transcription factor [Cyanobium sp. M30B3]|nr:MAG: response regulator transcription factor [Cyanobium sp. M30B3]